MADFQPGDKVLIRATVVVADDDGVYFIRTDVGGYNFYASAVDLQLALDPPYVDPEIVPGMVVAPLDDPADNRTWWVTETDTPARFFSTYGYAVPRSVLPAHIRPVFDPREATT